MKSVDYKDIDLPNGFLDKTVQICVVTHDLDKTVKQYADRLGVGPWWVHDVEPPLLRDARIRGVPTEFTFRMALAWTGEMMWEIIQPLTGPTVYRKFLEERGEGVQHVAFSYTGHGFEEAKEIFRKRGFEPVQEGNWSDIRFCYFDTEGPAHTTFEIFHWPPNKEFPEPQYWYPAKD